MPIIKLRFEQCLEVDVSCQNLRALRNTRLLRAYSMLSPLLHELVIAIKVWAKEAGVCGAADRNLSSYAYTLVAIYFMQVIPDVGFPCLSTEAFEHGALGWEDPRVRRAREDWKDPRLWLRQHTTSTPLVHH